MSLQPFQKSNCFCAPVIFFLFFGLVFSLEYGQKFPGLRPADAAGLNGSQQKWAEARPGGACVEASADRIQPRAAEERPAALRVTFP